MNNLDQAHPTGSPSANPGEILVERTIQFRNSTFGGLKGFIRDHQRKTGVKLTNAAAVDLLLRKELVRVLHPGAVRQMQELSRASGVTALQAVSPDSTDDGPPEALEAPQRRPKKIGLVRTPGEAQGEPRRGAVIAVDVRKFRGAA